MPVSAEGRVEHQKLNQTAALLSFGRVFSVQLDLLGKSDPGVMENLVNCPILKYNSKGFLNKNPEKMWGKKGRVLLALGPFQ